MDGATCRGLRARYNTASSQSCLDSVSLHHFVSNPIVELMIPEEFVREHAHLDEHSNRYSVITSALQLTRCFVLSRWSSRSMQDLAHGNLLDCNELATGRYNRRGREHNSVYGRSLWFFRTLSTLMKGQRWTHQIFDRFKPGFVQRYCSSRQIYGISVKRTRGDVKVCLCNERLLNAGSKQGERRRTSVSYLSVFHFETT